MTKSQNTTSEQLTEKWKKGELPEGYYYCKTENGDEILRTWRGIDGYLNFENMCNEVFISSMDDCEIIAPVPSYQWVINHSFKRFSQRLFEKTLEENAQLKELLKDARNVLKMVDTYYGDYDSIKGFLIVERIDEVLK